jgi:hypothetical protein
MRMPEEMSEDERVGYRNKVREVISILLESSFYLTVPLKERQALIRMIIDDHQFLSNAKARKC